jgi:hypothetical protein
MDVLLHSANGVCTEAANGVCTEDLKEPVRAGLARLRAMVDAVSHAVATDETEQRVFPYLDALKKTRGQTVCDELLPKPPLVKWLQDEDSYLTAQETRFRDADSANRLSHAELGELKNAIDAQDAVILECTKLGAAALQSTFAVDSDAADHIQCGRLQHLAQEHARVLKNSLAEINNPGSTRAQVLAGLYRSARCRQAIRALVEEDDLQIRRINGWLRWYGLAVVGFVAAAVLIAAAASAWLHFDYMASTPILVVPVAVLFWSFLGAVCATLYNFNIHPSSESSNFVKWLVTRPIVGLVFGAVTYFVLDSGLMAVRTNGASESGSSSAILVLCFLAAFSDRLALVIFRALIPPDWGRRGEANQRERRSTSERTADGAATA